MKRFATLLAVIVLATAPLAGQIVPGAGYINSTLSTNVNGKVNSDVCNGFYAGASMLMDIPSVKGLSFVPGAYLSLLSSSNSDSYSASILGFTISQSSKSTFTEISLNVPAYLKYGLNAAGGIKFYAFAGPTFQLGISSKDSYEASGLFSTDNTTDYYAGDKGYNRFNVYLGGGMGIGYGKFSLNVGYDYGLMNIYRGMNNVSGNRANLHAGVSIAL